MVTKLENFWLEQFLNNIPQCIYWKDKDSIYLGCNENFAKAAGFSKAKEVIGLSDRELSWGANYEVYRQEDLAVMESEKPLLDKETSLITDKGKQIFISVSKIPLRDKNGKIIGVWGTHSDITYRKQQDLLLMELKERAEAANRAKTEFLAAVSHELRIPLTGIIGMAQLLSIDCLLPGQKEQVADILKASEHLLAVVNDLLDLNKLEEGKMELHPTTNNIRLLIEEVANMLSFQAGAKGLELMVDFESDIPQQIITDARVLTQILLNLISNAIKFTVKGYILIKVHCLEHLTNKVILEFTVQDTGIGISPEKQQVIFVRFSQTDFSTARRYKGADLGLTLTKRLVELMGGSIHVESTLGKGSAFIFTLPFILSEELSAPTMELVKDSPVSWQSQTAFSARILLVEDDRIIQKVHKAILEKMGCSVDVAKNAEVALASLKQKYDLIFMDVGLPDQSGLEVTKSIRQHNGVNQHTPIIAITAFVHEEDKKNCLDAGMDAVATKPIMPDALNELLKRWVKVAGESQGEGKSRDDC